MFFDNKIAPLILRTMAIQSKPLSLCVLLGLRRYSQWVPFRELQHEIRAELGGKQVSGVDLCAALTGMKEAGLIQENGESNSRAYQLTQFGADSLEAFKSYHKTLENILPPESR